MIKCFDKNKKRVEFLVWQSRDGDSASCISVNKIDDKLSWR